MDNLILFEIGIVIFIALFVVVLLLLKKTAYKYPYYKNPFFISYAEQHFFRVLEQIIDGRYFIFPQVSLNSLLKVDHENTEEWWKYRNKIKQKSIDFVLADKQTFSPVLCIELDDYTSHSRPDRQRRDYFLDQAFAATNLTLLHVKNRRSYNVVELRREIEHAISSK